MRLPLRNSRLHLALLLLFTFLFNEFLVFYFKIFFTCSWPRLATESDISSQTQYIIFIADTHLLGRRKGHWFDKLRREWQMHRSYVSAIDLLAPNAVFFLGDLLDEGTYSNPDEFAAYADRFRRVFGPTTTSKGGFEVHALAGNHDLGFHYEIAPPRVEWFGEKFKRGKLVDVVSIGEIRFVLVTSMALHGDGCRLCYDAEKQLDELAGDFECARKPKECKRNPLRFEHLLPYSQPILLQHFPLFRPNDSVCEQDEDFDRLDPTRNETFRPKWECLDERSSRLLVSKLRPRLAFAGHTHRGCKRRWNISSPTFWEYTLNSFSWRNGNAPTFVMATVRPDDAAIATCYLPQETTVHNLLDWVAVIYTYALSGLIVLLYAFRWLVSRAIAWRRRKFDLPKVYKQN